MKTTRTHEIKAALVERYLSIVSMAETCHSTFAIYLENAKRLWDDPQFKRLPAWAQNYVQGYSDARFAELRRQLVFVHVWQGKVYKSTSDLPADARAYFDADPAHFDTLVSTHVWPTVREAGAPGGAFLLGGPLSYSCTCRPGFRPVENGDSVERVDPWGEWQDARGNVVRVMP